MMSLRELNGRMPGREKGGILVLAVMLIVPCLIFVALAIDLMRMSQAADYAKQTSQLSSIAAVESYFKSDSNLTEAIKLNDALSRANQVLNDKKILLSASAGSLSLSGGSDSAKLDPGVWHYTFPNPCSSSAPCFESVPVSSITTKGVNAFRMSGKMYQDIPTLVIQAVTNSSGKFSVSVDTVATVVPRRGCFLVDLSPSMVGETHDSFVTNATKRGATNAFFLQADNGTPTSTGHDTEWNGTMIPAGDRPIGIATKTLHYRNDYILKKTLSDSEYTLAAKYLARHPNPFATGNERFRMGNAGAWYRVDTFIQEPNYRGPEPLTTVMKGLNLAMLEFKARRVAGDKACLIFFDDRLGWSRTVPPTDDFDYLAKLTNVDNPGNLLADPLAITQSELTKDYVSGGLEQSIRHMILPRVNAFSNLNLALTEALFQLASTKPVGIPTADFVTMISDGLPNCCDTTINAAVCTPSCGDNYERFRESVKQLKNIALTQMQPKKIPLNFIAVGSLVAPHTLAVAKSPTSTACASDTDIRKGMLPAYVGGTNCTAEDLVCWKDAWFSKSPTNPFYEANKAMWELTFYTRGIWAPLRNNSAGCSALTTCTTTPTRRTDDPECRSMDQQMTDYIDRILGENPYSIVQSN